MDVAQLECFVTVAQTLNFSEAARRHYVSQSTVSRYIADLEKEFGVQLFTRSHRDVIITNEGKTLLPYALEMTDTLRRAKRVIREAYRTFHPFIKQGSIIVIVARQPCMEAHTAVVTSELGEILEKSNLLL